jgi:hypothetical protein
LRPRRLDRAGGPARPRRHPRDRRCIPPLLITPSGSLTTDVQSSLQALDAGKAPTSHTHVSTAISDSTTPGRALLTAPTVAAQNTLLGTSLLGFQPGNIKETAGLILETGWYWCDGSNKNRVTDAPLFNAITIQQSGILNSTAVVTGLSDTTNGGNTPISPGMPVSGIGVPANTVVRSVDSGTQVTLSQAATASATTPLVFAPYGVGDGTTTFGIPNRAYIAVGRDNASGSAAASWLPAEWPDPLGRRQAKRLAEKDERALSKILEAQQRFVRNLTHVAHRLQAGRRQHVANARRKLNSADRRVVR